MAAPVNRQQFKDYCLRRLGSPVVQINVDDEQVEERIDDALKYWQDYHFDGSNRVIIVHQVTEQEKTQRYIAMNNNVISVIDILPIGSDSSNAGNLFNFRYQLHLNDLYYTSAESVIPYYIAQLHISHLNELFVGKQPFRYNRHLNRLYIDMDWSIITTGNYIVIDAYHLTDPDSYVDVWDDWWLKKYATALIKKQWGENIKKYEGMQLPGGIQFNGQKIWDEANDEITKLEEEMIRDFSLPVVDFYG